MKRIIIFTILTIITSYTWAYDFMVGGIAYDISNSSSPATAMVTYGPDYTGNVTIPSSVVYNGKNYSITAIGDYSFSGCTNLNSVSMSSTIVEIQYFAFYNCSNLTAVSLSGALKVIPESCFSGCHSLSSLSIPNTVTEINDNVFFDCQKLTSITFPNSVTSIGSHVFDGCFSLNTVVLPQSITTIGDYTFYGCSELSSITLPNSVSTIGNYSFVNCYKLNNIQFPSSLTSIGLHAFENCTSLSILNFDQIKLSTINDYSFNNCASLSFLNIPSSVTSIGNYAFANCSALTTIIANPATPVNITNKPSVFANINKSKCTLYVPSLSMSAYSSASQWNLFNNIVAISYDFSVSGIAYRKISSNSVVVTSGGLYSGSITIPTSVSYSGTTYSIDSVDVKAFYNCLGLKSVTLSNSIKAVGNSAFYGCVGLSTISLPSSVIRLGEAAFSNCTGITSFTFPNSLNRIGSNAFEGCTGLTSVSLPNNITSIENYTFSGCSGLTSVNLPSSLTTLGDAAFYNCSQLNTITLPNSVISIGGQTFRNCSKLSTINFSTSLISIDSRAFYGCISLTLVVLPVNTQSVSSDAFDNCYCLIYKIVSESNVTLFKWANAMGNLTIPYNISYLGKVFTLTSISSSAFKDCTGLLSINIPASVTTIGTSAFYRCYDMQSVTITTPSSLNIIENEAFSECISLSSITIPASVKSIGNEAFWSCTKLTNMTISTPSSLTTIGSGAFAYCPLSSVIFPSSLTTIASGAFSECRKLSNATFTNPSTLNSIDFGAFSYCESLNSISLPNSLTSIGMAAFDSTGLTTISIPASVLSIGLGAFAECPKLKSIDVDGGNLNYSSINGILFNKSQNSLIQFPAGNQLTTYTIPSHVTSVEPVAFGACYSLSNITIPNTVNNLGHDSFNGCVKLSTIHIINKIPSLISMGEDVFYDVPTATCNLFIPSGSKSLYTAASQWKDFTNITEENVFTISPSTHPTNGGAVSGSGIFISGMSCTLKATPNTGYIFTNWTENGTVVSTSASYTFTVSAARTLVANFAANTCAIAATANPTVGGTITGTGNFAHGVSCTLKATPNTGYTFTNWTENGTTVSTSASYTFILSTNRTLVANFTENPVNYTISTSANPTAGGTTTGSGTFISGSSKTVTATPNTGYTFENWTENGAVVSASASYTFTLSANRTLVANFTQNPVNYTINASANPTAGGTTTGSGTFVSGSSKTVTATPNTGYTFANWTENGTVVSTSASYTFTLSANRTLVANFTQNPVNYIISTSAIPTAGGTTTGSGTFVSGSLKTVIATPNTGYTFANWTENGNVVSTSASYTFTLSTNRTLVANFTQNPVNYTISTSANPTAGGTTTGSGTFVSGSSKTVTATANTGYTFTNWTENGIVVSTNVSYTFVVMNDRNIIANFALIDQGNELYIYGAWSTGVNWQSFTSGISGKLYKIDIRLFPAAYGQIKINLYEGEGISGNLIHSQNINTVPNWNSFDLNDSIYVNENSKYTIEKIDISGNNSWTYNNTNPYSRGVCNNGIQIDALFRTYVIKSLPNNTFDIVGKDIRIYPNPVKDELNIVFDGETTFSIINLMGQVIYRDNLINNAVVQTANFPSGVYLIMFKTGKIFEYRKFIKE